MSDTLLPFYGNGEDLDKVVIYLTSKPTGAAEKDIERVLGAKAVDPRKYDYYDVIGLFTRTNGLYRLSREGINYSRGGVQEKRNIIAERVRAYGPYMAILEWALHNNLDILDADAVKHEWVQKFEGELDVSNSHRLNAAPITFFNACQMAGWGKYFIGRRGAKSRLEIDRAALERELSGQVDSVLDSSAHTKDLSTPPVEKEPVLHKAPAAAATSADRVMTELQITVPVFGKIAKLIWPDTEMTAAEWQKFKRVGDAMFLDE